MRWGLLGTGDWAGRTHAPGLAAAGEDLVAVWGRNPDKARALADQVGARAYEDVDGLLDAVDAVAIALPPDVQAPLAARAARGGKHLLLDKPLALDVTAADDVVAAVRETGVSSVVFFTNRFRPATTDFLAEAAGRRWSGGRATLLASLTGVQWDGSPWRRQHGGLWDVGPHALSVLLPVLGPVERVESVAGADATTVLLAHQGGATSTMTLGLQVPPAAATWEVVFWGEPGWASVPNGGDVVEAYARAVRELAPDHPCGVSFARDVVAVLASAERR